MSSSAPKFFRIHLRVALAVGLLLTIAWIVPAYSQDQSLPPGQLVELLARVRESSPGGVTPLNAVAVAQRLLSRQRYSEAEELFDALLEKLPSDPAVLYGSALAKFNLNKAGEAEPLARSCIEILAKKETSSAVKSVQLEQRRRGADALVLLAVILGSRGADTEALTTVKRAVTLMPEHFDAQFTLGRALFGVGETAAAAMAFRAALKVKPNDAKTLFFLATALENSGDPAAALKAYQELVIAEPQAAEGYLGLGVLLLKGGRDTEKGIQELKIALSINPDLYEARVNLGRALLLRNRVEESLPHLRRAAELAPTNPEPHYQLALAYRRLRMNDKAAEETETVRRIHETRRGTAIQSTRATTP